LADQGPSDAINEALNRLFEVDGGQDLPLAVARANTGAAVAVAALGRLNTALPLLRDDLNATRKRAADRVDVQTQQMQAVRRRVQRDAVLRDHLRQTLQAVDIRRENLAAAGNARAQALTAAQRAANELLRLAAGGGP